jgi:hypothetical protein
MKKLATVLSLCLMVLCSSNVSAQTTYKSDSGFFSPIIESLYLRGGNFEDAKLIGPAVGYRFNEMFDLTIHTEFLSNEYKFNNIPNPKTTLLNLGAILGHTDNLSDKLLLRSEASLYQSVIFNTEGYSELQKPSLTSGVISSSLYRKFSLSDSIILLPNAGAFVGYGNYTAPYSSANLRQGFNDFIAGPRFGFDISLEISDSFYLVVNPEISIPLNSNESEDTLLFNIHLNF